MILNSRSAAPRYSTQTLVALLLAVGTLGVFAKACGNGFLTWDDGAYVTNNANVRGGLTAAGLIWAWQPDSATCNWHPLTWISMQLDAQVTGADQAWGFHLTNVLLHVANTLLLFGVLIRLTKSLWPSALVAALFALHPLRVESVAWVAERKDVLSCLFWLLTLWAYAWYAERPGIARYLGVVALFTLGLLSKPMLMTLPFVLLLLDYWPLGRVEGEGRRAKGEEPTSGSCIGHEPLPSTLQSPPSTHVPTHPRLATLLLEKLPLLLLAAACGVMTVYAQRPATSGLESMPISLRLENAVMTYLWYLGQMMWPARLSPFYAMPANMLPAWQLATALTVLGATTVLAVTVRRRFPYLPVGWLWYLGTLVPVIGIVQVGVQGAADRYTYIPLIGIFVALGWGLADLAGHWRLSRPVIAVPVLAALAAFAAVTWKQIDYWHDTIALWRYAARIQPNNDLALINLADALLAEKRPETIDCLQRLLEMHPDEAPSYYNLGTALIRLGRLNEALPYFRHAVQLAPENAEAHNQLGRALQLQGDWEQAIQEYSKALQIQPHHSKAHSALACALAQVGKTAEALPHFVVGIQAEPDNAELRRNYGLALQTQGALKRAQEQFAEAVRIKPDFAAAYESLGAVCALQGKKDEASQAFQEAARLQHLPYPMSTATGSPSSTTP
jgi:tetratricopeptide (TPR) repeat protein